APCGRAAGGPTPEHPRVTGPVRPRPAPTPRRRAPARRRPGGSRGSGRRRPRHRGGRGRGRAAWPPAARCDAAGRPRVGPLLLVPLAVAALEALHPAAGVDQLLLAGEERVALVAELHAQLTARRG